MDLDFLNNATTQTEAAEGGEYIKHPCGTFQGTIERIEQKTVNNRPVWELFIRTKTGTANHSRWGFSAEDIEAAKQYQDKREQLTGTIARHKRLMVDCGLWDKETSMSKNWNDILSGWSLLQGRRCELVVKPNQKKQGSTITFVNAPRDVADTIDSLQPTQTTGSTQSAPQAAPAASSGVSNRMPPGSGSSLDRIPF